MWGQLEALNRQGFPGGMAVELRETRVYLSFQEDHALRRLRCATFGQHFARHREESNKMINGTNTTIRPCRCTETELAKVGVVMIDETNIRLGCSNCGREWSPNFQ